MNANFRFSGIFLLLLIGPACWLQAQDQGSKLIPHGSFEDSNEVRGLWHQPYGTSFFEDSISLKGNVSLGLEERNGHIDVFIDSIRPEGTGDHQLSFWYRAREGHTEGAPFWVEVMQGGRSLQVFRPGSEKARTRKLARDWILFSADVRVLDPAPLKIFIHSDLPRLWLDDVGLKPVAY